LWDTIEITTYLQNVGDSMAFSPLYPSYWPAVVVQIDSLKVSRDHNITYLAANYFLTFKDTAIVLKGPFALATQCDPLWKIETNGAASVNNVLAWTYNFHPTIYYDTITLVHYDTVNQSIYIHDTTRIKDTLRITTQIHDTLRIVTQIRDTIIKSDTLRITKTDTLRFTKSDTVYRIDTLWKHDTLKTSASPYAVLAKQRAKVYGEIYNVIGQCIWKGYEIEGAIPRIKYSQGIHVLIQGSKRKMFKVLYN
jgi:hypothetical protein